MKLNFHISFFIIGQNSIFLHQIRAYKINSESVTHFSQRISVKVKVEKYKKISGSISGKLRKLRLRQNDGFLIKKRVFYLGTC